MKNIGFIKKKTSANFSDTRYFPFDPEFENSTGFPVFEGYTKINIRDERLTIKGGVKVSNSTNMLQEVVNRKYNLKDGLLKVFLMLKVQGRSYMAYCYPSLEELKAAHKGYNPYGFTGIFNNLERDDSNVE